MRRFAFLLMLVWIVSACGPDGDDRADTSADTSATTTSQTTTTSVPTADTTSTTTAPATTTTQPPTTTLITISGDLDDWEAVGLNAAQGFTTSVEAKDAETFVSYFTAEAQIIDPINPAITLRPAGYAGYLFDRVGEDVALGPIHVNAGGTAEQRIAMDFFQGIEPLPANQMVTLRHLTLEDGNISRLVHYFEFETATENPEAVVTVVGFPPGASFAITDTAPIAQELFDGFFAAWSTADMNAITALYSEGGTRTDALLGSVNSGEMPSFVAGLLEDHPELTLEPGLTYLNGWGCAAAYTFTGADCRLPTISVFGLTAEGTIAAEYVYYDPVAARECGWAT